jgi:uncharacterized pyridoxal phosphate-containing UPF0001 family protein
MGMATFTDNQNQIKKGISIQKVFRPCEAQQTTTVNLSTLHGMSGDFIHLQIECGSNMVRVGSSIWVESSQLGDVRTATGFILKPYSH